MNLGQVVMTRGVADWACKTPSFNPLHMLQRHKAHDWGEVCDEDKAANDFALENGERVLSAYTVAGKKLWIITEWDRSVTTLLFPEEY